MDRIINQVIEALTSRGYAESEARLMVAKVQAGNENITVPIDEKTAKMIYDRGFSDGIMSARYEQQLYYARLQSQQFNTAILNGNGNYGIFNRS